MTVFSLDPDFRRLGGDKPILHQFPVLGELAVGNKEVQHRVRFEIEKALSAWPGDIMLCFEPRQCVRISDGTRTYDFMLCYECLQMYVYEGEVRKSIAGIGGSPAILNEILAQAGIPFVEANANGAGADAAREKERLAVPPG